MTHVGPDTESTGLPAAARVVVIGGGVIGCSVAYHLTKRGWTDVVLLERDALGCGTTWHAHGLVGLLRANPNLTRLAMQTNEVLPQLEAETGMSTGFKQNGSLIVTADRDHLEQLQRMSAAVRRVGLDLERISIAEAARIWPLLETRDLIGAFFMPSEGQTNPTDTVLAYAQGARLGGARIFEHTEVTAVHCEGRRVCGVTTATGRIDAEFVVNCAGVWGWELGRLSGVSVPVLALEQSYIVTEPIAELAANTPMLRDFRAGIGVREDALQLTIGVPAQQAIPWGTHGIPEGFSFDELAERPEQLEPIVERMLHRIPALEHTGIRKFLTGPDPYSPDSLPFMGEVPELDNYFVVSGLSGVGVGSSGGIGCELAGWIVDGEPGLDLWSIDVRRFMPFQASRRYQHDRVSEGGSGLFEIFWPHHQPLAARDVRHSPLHTRLLAAGAQFDLSAGWERPAWYDSCGPGSTYVKSYARQPWFELCAAEHMAAGSGVALSDLSGDAKFLVQGRAAETALSTACSADIAGNPGTVVLSPLLNQSGGMEALADVHRLAEDRFLVITESALQTKIHQWLKRHVENDWRASVTDVTSGFAVLALAGARAHDLLSAVGVDNVSDESRPIGTFRLCDIGYTQAWIIRRDCSTVPAWEICMQAEFAISVYDALVEAGSSLGIHHIGWHARQSLLLESQTRHRGEIPSALDTPLEAGLGHLIDWHKPDGFIGDAALERQRQGGVCKHLTGFVLEDPEPLLFANEPVLRNGRLAGHVVSGAYGHRLGAAVALARLESEMPSTSTWVRNARYEIMIGDERKTARLLSGPPD